jgi:hypothetical protein
MVFKEFSWLLLEGISPKRVGPIDAMNAMSVRPLSAPE